MLWNELFCEEFGGDSIFIFVHKQKFQFQHSHATCSPTLSSFTSIFYEINFKVSLFIRSVVIGYMLLCIVSCCKSLPS